MADTIFYRFVVKRDTKANFVAANTLLLSGEWSLETDTGDMKLGDGATAYNSLAYKIANRYAVASGTANALTATIPFVTLVNGVEFRVRAAAANTSTAPTFNPNGLGALTICKNGGQLLGYSDIKGAGHELILRYNSAVPRYELINPAEVKPVFALTDAATVAVDAAITDNFRVVLAGNRTLGNPTNLVSGQVINMRIVQDGTGSRTLAYGSKYKFPNATAPVLSTAANAKDFLSCQYDDTTDTLFCVLNKAFG